MYIASQDPASISAELDALRKENHALRNELGANHIELNEQASMVTQLRNDLHINRFLREQIDLAEQHISKAVSALNNASIECFDSLKEGIERLGRERDSFKQLWNECGAAKHVLRIKLEDSERTNASLKNKLDHAEDALETAGADLHINSIDTLNDLGIENFETVSQGIKILARSYQDRVNRATEILKNDPPTLQAPEANHPLRRQNPHHL